MTIDLGGGHSTSIGDFKVIGPGWLGIPIFILFIASVCWIMIDAEKRGKSGCVALLFLFAATWPVSILWWLWLRPPLEQTPEPPPQPPLQKP
jgi:hypothetical protein